MRTNSQSLGIGTIDKLFDPFRGNLRLGLMTGVQNCQLVIKVDFYLCLSILLQVSDLSD